MVRGAAAAFCVAASFPPDLHFRRQLNDQGAILKMLSSLLSGG